MNIEEYKFSSESAFALTYQKNQLVVVYNEDRDNYIGLNKDDVIALAKHFDLLEDK